MTGPRWRKLLGDLRAARGRILLIVLALAVSVAALDTVLGARTVLLREIAASYVSSAPADATLVLAGDASPELVASVRARPEIAAAEARAVLGARLQAAAAPPSSGGMFGGHGHLHAWSNEPSPPGQSSPFALHVVDDFAAVRVNTVHPESGAWPPPAGTLAVERSAVPVIGAGAGQTVTLQLPGAPPRAIAVTAIVHDPGLAPAWQEHQGYGYIDRATLATLVAPAPPPPLPELRVAFRPAPATTGEAERAAVELARWLTGRGHAVREVRVPALHQHPHQSQMVTAQTALLLFGLLLLVLSAILVATLLAALLARQTREIGIMKALGARTGQLAGVYVVFVAVVGAAALAVGGPLGWHGARAFSSAIAGMMNLRVADPTVPLWVHAVVAVVGLAVPLGFAAIPIRRACRGSIREAFADHGTRGRSVYIVGARPWLPFAARNALRRPARLAFALALLAASGTVAITALAIKRGYERTAARLPEMRFDDLEIVTADDVAPTTVARIAALPGVRAVELWAYRAAVVLPDAAVDQPFFVARTYPDQGHGAFRVLAPPPGMTLARYPLVAGRWLADPPPAAGDDEIVIDRFLAGDRFAVGDHLDLSIGGARSRWRVVGIIDQIPPSAAYISQPALARATGAAARRDLRIATTAGSPELLASVTAASERALAEAGTPPQRVTPFPMLRGAIDDHLVLVTTAVLVLGAIVALVGLLGLAAMTSANVLERTRELGVLKALGATRGRIVRIVVGEAALIGLASWAIAAAASLVLTYAVQTALASKGFLLAAYVISPAALAGWFVIAIGGSALAALVPALRAARLRVRAALAAA